MLCYVMLQQHVGWSDFNLTRAEVLRICGVWGTIGSKAEVPGIQKFYISKLYFTYQNSKICIYYIYLNWFIIVIVVLVFLQSNNQTLS
jgi:hypothetical protein